MKGLGLLIGGLAISAALAAEGRHPFADPAGYIREKLVQVVARQTGREIRVTKGVTLAYYPHIGAHLHGVTISGPPGARGQTVLTAQTLTVDVSLLSLLRRTLEVDLIVQRPEIHLRIDAQGRKNWDLAARKAAPQGGGDARGGGESAAGRLAGRLKPSFERLAGWFEAPDTGAGEEVASDTEAGKAAKDGGWLSYLPRLRLAREIRINKVRIVDGTLHWQDARRGRYVTVHELNLTGAQAGREHPFVGQGSVRLRDEVVQFDVTTGSLLALARGQIGPAAPLAVRLQTPFGTGELQGVLRFEGGARFAGEVRASSRRPARLAHWLGLRVPDALPVMRALEASALLQLEAGRLALRDIAMQVDAVRLEGQATARLEDFGWRHFERLSGSLYMPRLSLLPGRQLRDIRLRFAQDSAQAPLAANGHLVLMGESARLSTELPSLNALSPAGWHPLKLKIATTKGRLRLAGQVRPGLYETVPEFRGRLELSTRSPARLAGWLAGEPVSLAGVRSLDVVAEKARLGPQLLVLGGARFTMTGARGTGELSLIGGGRKPVIRGLLALDELDIKRLLALGQRFRRHAPLRPSRVWPAGPNPFLVAFGEEGDAASSFAGGGTHAAGGTQQDVGERSARLLAVLPHGGDGRIALDWLQRIDMALTLKPQSIRFGAVAGGPGRLDVQVKEGRASLKLVELAFYGGQARGHLAVDGRRSVPALSLVLGLKQVEIAPLLMAVKGKSELSGRGKLRLALSAAGKTPRAMLASLDGEGRIKLENGRYTDNTEITSYATGFLKLVGARSLIGRRGELVIDYDSVGGAFTVRKGVVAFTREKPLRLRGPEARADINGVIDLPANRVNFSNRLRLGRAAVGGDNPTGMGGFAIQLEMKGPIGAARGKILPATFRLIPARGTQETAPE